jgi:hypothetical protein
MKNKHSILQSRAGVAAKNLYIFCAFFAIVTLNANAQDFTIGLTADRSGVMIDEDNIQKLKVRFTYEGINAFGITSDKGLFNEISIPGTHSIGGLGTPKLPATKKLIEVPFGASINVTVNNYSVSEYKLSDYGVVHSLMPVQPSLRKDQNPDEVAFEYREELYQKDAFIKHPVAEVEELGTMRGVRIARLTVAPVSYNPVSGIIRVCNDIDVSIDFAGVDAEMNQYIKSSTYSPYFEGVYSALLNNPIHGYPNHPDLTTYPVKYLIVSDPMFETDLQPFIEWKTMKGFEVIVAYTDVIGNTYNAIQTWVHNQYNSATPDDPAPSFLLLVGDTPQIPATVGSSSGKMTDLYYASVDGDYFPEMYYGRFSATNSSQLIPQIEKTLYYEQYEFADPTFLNKTTLIAGADGTWNPAVGQPTIIYGTDNYFNTANGYTNVYDYLTSPYTGCYDPERIAVSLINYTAHCSQTSWGTPQLTQSMVNNFVNANQYPLAIGNCCLAADFGYSECIGETWMRAANKGSVAYIGSSPNSYWFEDFYWSVGAFPIQGNNGGYVPTYAETTWGAYDGPFVSDYVSTGGIIFVGNLAVTEVDIQNYPSHSSPLYYWQAYNVLGDPSLVVYHTEGSVNNVSHLDIFPIGLDFYEVTAEPGSYVGISKDGVLHGSALVGPTGVVDIPVTPVLSSGMVDIVVTKPQYEPYIEQVPAASLDGPFIVLDDYIINDFNGNNNGLADYGEDISLHISLKNVGSDASGIVMATLTTSDSYVGITGSNSQSFGAIAAGAVITVNDAFSLSIADDAPDQHVSVLNLEMSDSDTTWNSTINLVLYAPAFTVSNILTIDDFTGGNNNGQADPGETLNLIISNTNSGSSDAFDLTGVLTCQSPYVTLLTSSYNIALLGAGETQQAVFSVIIDADTPIGTPVFFEYNVNAGPYGGGNDFIIVIGLIYEDFETGDFAMFGWTFAGQQPWVIADDNPYEGIYSAKSGSISHNQSSHMILEYEVGASDSISFYRKVSSENNYDYLRFYINDVQKGQWSGEVAWGRVAYAVDEGLNVFKWEYDKDVSVSSGQDCGWVDYIVFPAPVVCPNPQNPYAYNVTAVSAMLDWDSGGGESVWDMIYGLEGFDPELEGTLLEDITEKPYQLTGLDHATAYDFYVRADCEADGHSSWTGPATFNTLCDAFEVPYNEGFSGGSVTCWSFPDGQANWDFGDAYTPPASTSGTPNAFFSGSPQLNSYSNSIVSPVIDATDAANIKLDYILFLNSQSNSTLEQLTVEYKAIDSDNWLMLEIFGNSGIGSGSQQFLRTEQSLVGMQGQQFQVRFRAHGINSSNINGWGLDDVLIYGDNMTAGISIAADADEVCEQTLVTFTAIPVNGGDNPSYQWYVNGDEVGDNIPEYAYHPDEGDQICCELTSSMPGVNGSPAMSEIMSMTVYPNPLVVWNGLVYDTVCLYWDDIQLTDGQPEGGIYSGNGVSNGYFSPESAGVGLHTIYYTYTNEHNCTASDSASIFVDYCTWIQTSEKLGSIRIYPNPATSVVNIYNHDPQTSVKEIHLYDLYGRKLMSGNESGDRNPVQLIIGQLNKGIYMIEVITENTRYLQRIMLL